MFVAEEIKQTLLRKFSEVFFDSPFIFSIKLTLFPMGFQIQWLKDEVISIFLYLDLQKLPYFKAAFRLLEIYQGGIFFGSN